MTALLLVAALATAVMGFAIQRGATCTVAAVAEIIDGGRTGRLVALVETALWVSAGILAARLAGVTMALPPGFAIHAATIVGGVLLGLGAVVNGACVFGAVARLGSGEWAFAATPLGFYLGCRVAVALGGGHPLPVAGMPAAAGVVGLAALLVVVIALRGSRLVRLRGSRLVRLRGSRLARLRGAAAGFDSRWNPHVATLVIGVCFVVTLLTAGAWAYTEALADLARGGMSGPTALRLLLFVALLGGAVLGGASAGRLSHRPPRPAAVARCLAGGALMAAGSLLIPGSNDGLILLGLPLLQPYAWLAFAVMAATVTAALLALRRFSPSVRARPSAAR